jgi:hypothetical protein
MIGASEDVAPSADLLFRYVAAVMDEDGPNEIRRLIGAGAQSNGEPSEELCFAFTSSTAGFAVSQPDTYRIISEGCGR